MSQKTLSAVFPRWLLFSALLLVLLALSGCSCWANRTQYRVKTKPMAFKRAPRYIAVDYIHRFRTRAFCALKPDPASASVEERAILDKHGAPDYTRTFRTRPLNAAAAVIPCEKVTEWVYLDQDLLVQFVQGDLAFSGPVTDLEKLLIDRGYPTAYYRTDAARGPERYNFMYRNFVDTQCDVYSFADGKLVEMQEN